MQKRYKCGKKVLSSRAGAHAPIILKYNEIREIQQFFNTQTGWFTYGHKKTPTSGEAFGCRSKHTMRKLHSCNIRAFWAKKVRYLASGQRSVLYGSFGLESGDYWKIENRKEEVEKIDISDF